MRHKEMLCTCCRLVLVSRCLVAPLHRIEALQLAGMPVIKNTLQN